jgi:cardiolipin synthase
MSAPSRSPAAVARSIFTLPNALTLIRLPLAALLWVSPASLTWLLTVVLIAAATDLLDGRFAGAVRMRNPDRYDPRDEAIGAWLDPLCDKLFTASALGVLWFGFGASLGVIVMVLARDLLIAPLILLYQASPSLRRALHFDFHADWLGKTTTALQFTVAGAILVWPAAAFPLAALTAVVGVVSTAHYLHRGLQLARAAASPIRAASWR